MNNKWALAQLYYYQKFRLFGLAKAIKTIHSYIHALKGVAIKNIDCDSVALLGNFGNVIPIFYTTNGLETQVDSIIAKKLH